MQDRKKERKKAKFIATVTTRQADVAKLLTMVEEESMRSFLHYRQHSSSGFFGAIFRILAIFFQEKKKKKPRNFL